MTKHGKGEWKVTRLMLSDPLPIVSSHKTEELANRAVARAREETNYLGRPMYRHVIVWRAPGGSHE